MEDKQLKLKKRKAKIYREKKRKEEGEKERRRERERRYEESIDEWWWNEMNSNRDAFSEAIKT